MNIETQEVESVESTESEAITFPEVSTDYGTIQDVNTLEPYCNDCIKQDVCYKAEKIKNACEKCQEALEILELTDVKGISLEVNCNNYSFGKTGDL